MIEANNIHQNELNNASNSGTLNNADDSSGIMMTPLAQVEEQLDNFAFSSSSSTNPDEQGRVRNNDDNDMLFNNIAGTISSSEKIRFERMLFRSTRGNCYIRFSPLNETALDINSQYINRICFIIFYKSKSIEEKIIKICNGFNIKRYNLNSFYANSYSNTSLEIIQTKNYNEIIDLKKIIEKNMNSKMKLCKKISAKLLEWLWVINREKNVYHILNMFKSNNNVLQGHGWILSDQYTMVKNKLKMIQNSLNNPLGSSMPDSNLGPSMGNSISSIALMDVITNKKWPTPPTYFYLNKYTYAYQEFINTYGIPKYREINPAVFTMVSFPFLFGVMYGDIGHGGCVALGGLFLIYNAKNIEGVDINNIKENNKANHEEFGINKNKNDNLLNDEDLNLNILVNSSSSSFSSSISSNKIKPKQKVDELLQGLYMARYMIFLMGVFGVVAGVIYNDYFAMSLNIFGSNYHYHEDRHEGDIAEMQSKYGDANSVYLIGIDPVWKVSSNELLFYNSFKMKFAIIIGVIQMTIGIVLNGMNTLYFKNYVNFFHQFLPMIIFDVVFFGYIVLLIFVKWAINWDERMALGTCGYDINGTLGSCSLESSANCYNANGDICTLSSSLKDVCTLDYGGEGDGCQPPNLITTLIDIALKPGSVSYPMFSGQATIQVIVLLVAFLCVPWLLLAKPIILKYKYNKLVNNKKKSHYNFDTVNSFNPASDIEAVESSSVSPSDDNMKTNNPIQVRDKFDDMPDENSDEVMNLIKKQQHGSDGDHSFNEEDHYPSEEGHDEEHEEFNFGEIFIHQAIETIEFVLGMISNTASYLRLWALSLAHAELANVFWTKVMVMGIDMNSVIGVFIGYSVFAAVTTGVLLMMDVLECFLHALRLHWVEFQNKFFKADGYRFQPFDFHDILAKINLE